MPHPDDIDDLRDTMRALKDDSFSGWHGNDRPVVAKEEAYKGDIGDMLKKLDRRTSERLREYRERQYFTKPSTKRRRARQEAKYKIRKSLD